MTWEGKRFKFIFFILYMDEGKGKEKRGEKIWEKRKAEWCKWFLI